VFAAGWPWRIASGSTIGSRDPAARTEQSEVLAAAWELDRIAEKLLTPGPVAASGVAQVRLLLIDGAGPLYTRDGPLGLRAAATRALDALQPAFHR
jgi:hypothetical protein